MKDVICDETARHCRQVFGDRLRALVITGSLARNEGTFVNDGPGSLLLGDAEFLLVFHDRSAPPIDGELRTLGQQVEEGARRRGLRAEIALTAVRPGYLRRLPPSIFAYELRHSGETVAGDAEMLALVPAFAPDDIPREDAWRLLANRLVEQLEGVGELLAGRPMLSPKVHYRTVKLYLDMATSLLIFAGRYAPTYQERARNLAMLVGSPGVHQWPFPPAPFVKDVEVCTEWKIAPREPGLDATRAFWERAMGYARALWRWELAQLYGPDADGSPEARMVLWARRQLLPARLRGWAHVMRRQGWHRSWFEWSRWLRLARHASPRHLIYATGSALLFELAGPADKARSLPSLERLRGDLPVPVWPGQNGHGDSLQSLAEAVVQNYKNFVAETRA